MKAKRNGAVYRRNIFDDAPTLRRKSEAFAELLGLGPLDVVNLVDLEPQPLHGQRGELVYGYRLDFAGLASAEIAARILQQRGSLQLFVGPDFFDSVADDE